jgi:hypothetical protein
MKINRFFHPLPISGVCGQPKQYVVISKSASLIDQSDGPVGIPTARLTVPLTTLELADLASSVHMLGSRYREISIAYPAIAIAPIDILSHYQLWVPGKLQVSMSLDEAKLQDSTLISGMDQPQTELFGSQATWTNELVRLGQPSVVVAEHNVQHRYSGNSLSSIVESPSEQYRWTLGRSADEYSLRRALEAPDDRKVVKSDLAMRVAVANPHV